LIDSKLSCLFLEDLRVCASGCMHCNVLSLQLICLYVSRRTVR
jgi:hypothetical protein